MKISVVIATMNRSADLQKALVSVLAQMRVPEEIWVIDQSTDDRSKDVVRSLRETCGTRTRLEYVYQEEKSLVKARNRGLDHVTGEIVSFLDDDIVLDADYFEKIAAEFVRDPKLAGLSGNARIPSPWTGAKWKLRQAIEKLFLINCHDGRLTASGLGLPIFDRLIDRRMEVDMLPGCNMNFRATALKGERFDEYFKGYSFREDAEFSYRISRNGPLRMIPDATLEHNYSTSSRLSEAQLKTMVIRNYVYVARKFKGEGFWARTVFAYSLAGMLLTDWLEYALNRTPEKRDKWNACREAVREASRARG